MIVTTNAAIAGKQITAYHGIASGNITYSRSFDKGIKAEIKQSLKSVMGGELVLYSDMKKHYFDVAMARLMADAKEKGANAIVGVSVSETASQVGDTVLVIGTAVTISD